MMKRRLTQIALAFVAVATLSACIIIQSETEPGFAPTAPAAPETGAER